MTEHNQATDIRVLKRTAEHLAQRYAGIFSPETVERCVFESYATLKRTARVNAFVTALAGHFAENRLLALAQAEGKTGSTVPQVLFVCVHNIGRSQIAAALLTHYAGEKVEVRSAGALPGTEVHPLVAEALTERGVELGQTYPKPVTDDVVRAADWVITIGGGEAHPVYPDKQYRDWPIDAPPEETLEQVREIVEEIDARVRDLWQEISVPVDGPAGETADGGRLRSEE